MPARRTAWRCRYFTERNSHPRLKHRYRSEIAAVELEGEGSEKTRIAQAEFIVSAPLWLPLVNRDAGVQRACVSVSRGAL